jgi:K(+)-stimulated pyrophosphate-energized sodium pump
MFLALGFAGYLAWKVLKEDEGTAKMKEISSAIHAGSKAYLSQQYKTLAIFFVVVFVVLLALSFIDTNIMNPYVPFAFLSGGILSALAGYMGMTIATKANARTASAAKKSLNSGLRVAFSSGAVMGLSVVGLGLLQVLMWYYILTGVGVSLVEISSIMLSFGMGASSMALFARVGGGIYTKAADVGADLVGKVEAGIPEDDPRNPAVIADNVGDNVGDVAGMGADLYESYLGSLIAAMALGAAAFLGTGLLFEAMTLPLVIAAIGIICSVFGTFLIKAKEDATQNSLLWALRRGIWGAAVLTAIIALFAVGYSLGWEYIGIYFAVLTGLVAGIIIGTATEYFTSAEYGPTKTLSKESETGPATIVIGGLSLGMKSTWIPVITVCAGIMAAFLVAGGADNAAMGLFGIGIAAVGMLSTLGITLATDAYGPVADNAGGIAEMAGLGENVRKKTDALDSLGNTTAATGKGFAIGSAALTALALLVAFQNEITRVAGEMGKTLVMDLSLTNPVVIVGLFIGGMLPFLFSSMTMGAVGRAAAGIVQEVRRQFKEIKGLMAGKAKPDYERCVAISTKSAQREMILPSVLAIVSPIAVGLILGPAAVVALLAGALVTGFVMAVFMANAGGAWDNAKKYIEAGALGGKGSSNHKAAVVGDTVGDPLKDTSGPSLNILIKLMRMVSIVFVGVFIAVL